jgi:hypothetical protein
MISTFLSCIVSWLVPSYLCLWLVLGKYKYLEGSIR